jgi:peroxiredoxin
MARTQTPMCEFGAAAIDFDLPGVDGRRWTLQQCAGERGLLVVFICNHCPFVIAIRERLVRDARELMQYGVHTVAIMSNDPTDYPEDSFENMQRIAAEFSFPFPYLLDQSQQVARAYGAVCTPDFFGYNRDLELQFRGRLDASGKDPAPPGTPRELFDAMKQIAETGQGPREQTPSIGCSIKWKQP